MLVQTHRGARLAERTVQAVSLLDFGPCTFPAYLGATAGARSLVDWYEPEDAWTPARRRARLLEAL